MEVGWSSRCMPVAIQCHKPLRSYNTEAETTPFRQVYRFL